LLLSDKQAYSRRIFVPHFVFKIRKVCVTSDIAPIAANYTPADVRQFFFILRTFLVTCG